VARHALLVAAARYDDPGYQQLRAPTADVQALSAALADPACGAFQVREPLINRDEPTLRGELEDFFDSAGYDDELLLYISSHGELRAGRLYFATTTTSRQRLRSTALADSFVHELMEHSPARTVVLVLDCCHSGAFGKGIPKAPPEIELQERFEGSGRVTMAASAQIEYAFEGEQPAATDHKLPTSVFTAALVDGLRGADANKDGIVTLDELYAFVGREVRRRNPQQTPRLLGDRAGEIIMARVPGGSRRLLPDELADEVESSRWAAGGRQITQVAHEGLIWGVAFSRDGRSLATWSEDKTTRVWELPGGGQVAQLAHEPGAYGVAFSPDGRFLAAASTDKTARVWELPGGRQITELAHNGQVYRVAFSRDGRYLTTASGDKTARVWELPDGRQLAQLAHEGEIDRMIHGVALSRDGRYLATASGDKTARVWELPGGWQVAQLAHEPGVLRVAFNPDGRFLATASDRTARVWELPDGRQVAQVAHERGWISRVAFSRDRRYLATSSGDNATRVWELPDGRQVAELAHDDPVYDVAFSPDGRYLATASRDNKARVWELPDGRQLAQLAHNDWVLAVAFSPDERYLATASTDKTARVWEPQS